MEAFSERNLIPCFSIQDLIEMSESPPKTGLLNHCAIFSDLAMKLNYPCRINAYIIGLCLSGSTSVSSDERNFKIEKNTLFVLKPNNILRQSNSVDFRAKALIISLSLLRQINISIKQMMPLFIHFRNNPTQVLSDVDFSAISGFLSVIERSLNEHENEFTKDIIGSLLSALFCKIGSITRKDLTIRDIRFHVRSDEKFCQFMILLSEHYRQERSVDFYAQNLCVTPKYLTSLIKKVSNETATYWINRYVILEAKELLKYTEKSVQEIAYYLNFPNQSFFGKYFKRHTGVPPMQYRINCG